VRARSSGKPHRPLQFTTPRERFNYVEVDVLGLRPFSFQPTQTAPQAGGCLRRLCIRRIGQRDTLVMVMAILPTFLHSFVAPRCAWSRLALSIAHCVKPMASASALWKHVVGNRRPLVRPIGRDRHWPQITMVIEMATRASVIA